MFLFMDFDVLVNIISFWHCFSSSVITWVFNFVLTLIYVCFWQGSNALNWFPASSLTVLTYRGESSLMTIFCRSNQKCQRTFCSLTQASLWGLLHLLLYEALSANLPAWYFSPRSWYDKELIRCLWGAGVILTFRRGYSLHGPRARSLCFSWGLPAEMCEDSSLPLLGNDTSRLTPQVSAGRRIKRCEGSCEIMFRAGAQVQTEVPWEQRLRCAKAQPSSSIQLPAQTHCCARNVGLAGQRSCAKALLTWRYTHIFTCKTSPASAQMVPMVCRWQCQHGPWLGVPHWAHILWGFWLGTARSKRFPGAHLKPLFLFALSAYFFMWSFPSPLHFSSTLLKPALTCC